MLRGAKNTVQGAKMAFGTPFLATPFGVALKDNFFFFFPLTYFLIFKILLGIEKVKILDIFYNVYKIL